MKRSTIVSLLALCIQIPLAAQSLYPVKRDGRWGYIDSTGAIRIPLRYGAAESFHPDHNSAVVMLKNKWGLIDKKGRWILKPTYDKIERFNGNLEALRGVEQLWIDASGKPISDPWPSQREQYSFEFEYDLYDTTYGWNGLRLVERSEKFGYVDSIGETVIPITYERAQRFWKGRAIVKQGKWGVIDVNENVLIPFEFDSIYILRYQPLIYGIRENSGYGLCDSVGTWILQPHYATVELITDSLFIVSPILREGERDQLGEEQVSSPSSSAPLKGVIDRVENQILPFEYSSIKRGNKNQYVVTKGSQWGIVNTQNKWLFDIDSTFTSVFNDKASGGYILVDQESDSLRKMRTDNRHWPSGLSNRIIVVDSTGNILIGPYLGRFSAVWSMPDLYIIEDARYGTGIMSLAGDTILKFSWDQKVTVLDSNLIKVIPVVPSYGCIRSDGRPIPIQFYSGYDFSGGINTVRTKLRGRDISYEEQRIIDTNGQTLFILADIGVSSTGESVHGNDLILLKSNRGTENFYTYQGEFRLLTRHSKGFSEGLAASYGNHNDTGSGYGFINTDGRMVIPRQFADAGYFREGLAPVAITVNDDLVWGYINQTGKWVIEPQFSKAKGFSEGLAPVFLWTDSGTVYEGFGCIVSEKYDRIGKWGFINRAGEFVLPLTYGSAYGFHDGVATVYADSGYVLIDRNGNELFPQRRFMWIGEFSEGQAPATLGFFLGGQTNGEVGFINQFGEWRISPMFDNAGSFHSGRAVVTSKHLENFFYINSKGEVVWKE
ncbi:MAG: WG repeat-containing protein [Ignavibacteriae bacterium]|nr:WG repeat-containing protein [Ignavibacteriota bacterium]MCB9215634.1 WG repeat-containing protein [Ignavibacteria bacterium]